MVEVVAWISYFGALMIVDFRTLRSKTLLPSLISLAIVFCAGSTFPELAVAQQNAEERNSEPQGVAELIQQLSASTYAKRQDAVERLWLMGKSIEPQLRDALEQAAPETKKRINGLLKIIDLDPNSSPELAGTIMSFAEGNVSEREYVLRTLANDGRLELYFELIQRIEDPRVAQQLFLKTCDVDRIAVRMATMRNWESMELLVEHPVARSFDPKLKMFADVLDGTFADETERMQKEVDQDFQNIGPPDADEIEAGKRNVTVNNFNRLNGRQVLIPPNFGNQRQVQQQFNEVDEDAEERQKMIARFVFDGKLRELISRLRILERREEAVSYAKMLSNRQLGFKLETQMLMEQEKWADVLKLVQVSDKTPEETKAEEAAKANEGGKEPADKDDTKEAGEDEDARDAGEATEESERTEEDERTQEDERKEEGEQPIKLPMTLAQVGLLQYYAGQTDELKKTLARLEKRVKTDEELEEARKKEEERKKAEGKKDQEEKPKAQPNPFGRGQQLATVSVTAHRKGLTNLYLVMGDWESARKLLKPDNKWDVYRLMIYLHRYDEAFELLGLTDDINQRFEWFEKEVAEIKQAFKKVEGNRQLLAELVVKMELCVAVAEHFESLGHSDEAAIQAKMLHAAIDPVNDRSANMRVEVVRLLMTLHRYDDVWKAIEDRFLPTDYIQLISRRGLSVSALAPNKEGAAVFWFQRGALDKQFPDPMDKLKVVLALVNSPIAPDDIDPLEVLVKLDNSPEAEQKSNLRGALNYWIAMSMNYHGEHRKYIEYLKLSRDIGYSPARLQLAKIDAENEKWQRTVDSHQFTSPFTIMMTAEGHDKLDQPVDARRHRLAAFASWTSNYRSTQNITAFESADRAGDLVEMLEIILFAPNQNAASAPTYRPSLAEIQKDDFAGRAETNWKIYALTMINHNANLSVAGFHQRIQVLAAKRAIQDGEYDRAANILEQLDRFRPGDPELGEVCLPLLDKAGQSAVADRVFERISEFYLDLIGKYPDSPLHLNNYAWVCATSKRRLEFAQQHADRALALRPDNTSYLDTVADLSFQNGDRERAAELIKRCLNSDPDKLHYKKQAAKFGVKKSK